MGAGPSLADRRFSPDRIAFFPRASIIWIRGEQQDHDRGAKDLDTLGLDVGDFETQEDFQRAFDARRLEKRQKEREEREAERLRWQNEQGYHRENADDETVYAVCGVELPHAPRPYHYKTGGLALEIGDKVLVPARDAEVIGTVVSVGRTLRRAAPFPIDWMKTIVRKLEDESGGRGI